MPSSSRNLRVILACRPTRGASAQLLATLTPPPAQAVCSQSLCFLPGQGPISALAALCQPAAAQSQSQDPPAQPTMLACWRIQHSITARSPAQMRSYPLVLDPSLTRDLSELGTPWSPDNGQVSEHADHSTDVSADQSRGSPFKMVSMPGLRVPALVLGSSDGICCLTLPNLLLPSADSTEVCTSVVLQGTCPPAAGEHLSHCYSSPSIPVDLKHILKLVNATATCSRDRQNKSESFLNSEHAALALWSGLILYLWGLCVSCCTFQLSRHVQVEGQSDHSASLITFECLTCNDLHPFQGCLAMSDA